MTRLNLGCRDKVIEGYDNLDKIYGWTFQEGLPFYEDNSVECITISHALMFLNVMELEAFLKEAKRVLKIGGVIRITEDDTENPLSDTYKRGCRPARPQCLTGPVMMGKVLESVGFTVFDMDEKTTKFEDDTLLQNMHGGRPRCFFSEGVKQEKQSATLLDEIKNTGSPYEIPNISRDDLPQFFVDRGYKVGAEIGTAQGEYTEKFCQNGLTIYAIDPWIAYGGYDKSPEHQKALDSHYQTAKERLSNYPNCKIIKKTSMKAVADFADNSLDFVYIDGNHEFKYVAQDIYEWTKKVKSGGIVSGHDYTYFVSKNLLGVCHVIPVLHAYAQSFGINNFYVLGRKKAQVGEIRDKWRSWMFVKP